MSKADGLSREERLAAQLRANLKRRKQQSREKAVRGADNPGDEADPPLPKGESTG